MLTDEDKLRIEAEELYRANIREKSGYVQKTDFGEYTRKTRKRFVVAAWVISGILLLAVLYGRLFPNT